VLINILLRFAPLKGCPSLAHFQDEPGYIQFSLGAGVVEQGFGVFEVGLDCSTGVVFVKKGDVHDGWMEV
jgi:hypothetical protein